MPIDKETADILDEGEELALMVKGRGWNIAKNKMFELLMEYDIENIDTSVTDSTIAKRVKLAKSVLKTFKQWINIIENDAFAAKTNSDLFDEKERNHIIRD